MPVPTLPTDSSQLEALTHAASGRHLVVHGPPGTGKSQTIANLIADALARNQRVLFVSAKMAALNVVYDRLRELGLDRFCLEAHSTKAGKAKVIDELRRTIEAESATDSGKLQEELQSLTKVREQLNAYVRALHSRVGPLGLTAYRAEQERKDAEKMLAEKRALAAEEAKKVSEGEQAAQYHRALAANARQTADKISSL